MIDMKSNEIITVMKKNHGLQEDYYNNIVTWYSFPKVTNIALIKKTVTVLIRIK